MKKLKLEEVQAKIDIVQNGRIKIVGNYRNTHEAVLVKCNVCGIEWYATAKTLSKHKVGIGCKHHVSLTSSEVSRRVALASNKTISMVGKYQGAKAKTAFKCLVCNNTWETEPYIIYSGHGCPYCSHNHKWTFDEMKDKVKKLTNGEYEIFGEYSNTKKLVNFKHLKCGKTFKMTPHAFISGSQRCPFERLQRAFKKNVMKQSVFETELFKSCHGEYTLLDGYVKATGKATFKHKKCGKKFQAYPTQILHKASGCPFCNSSKGEDAVRNYLIENGYCFKEQYKIDECKYKRVLPFDFALFDNAGLMLCLIEYQGIQHYKPKFGIKNLELTQIRDNIKYNYCKNHKINLIRIPYKRSGSFEKLQLQVNEFLNDNLTSQYRTKPDRKRQEGVTTR